VKGRVPLVGRDRELAALDAALGALAGGAGGALAVVGEPGIGKSSLLAEVCSRADARGWLALAGRGTELEGEVPFGVWVDALDPYLGSVSSGRLRPLPEPHQAELAAVFPALAWLGGERESRLEAERYRAHHAVRGLLELLARETPCVLALDDMHWADPASIELLAHLLRRRAAAPLLLVLALRPAQAPRALFDALRNGGCESIEPRRLTREEADELLGKSLDRAERERVYGESGGNPFYLDQLARSAPAGRAAAGGAVPDPVRAALAAELSALSARARRVLQAAALAGEPFEPDVVAAVAEVEERQVLAAIDDGLERDLLRTTEVPRLFAFRHPIVRLAVYESAGEGWRVGAHARAAAALEARGEPAAVRAHHVERSARPGDDAAVALLAEAARESASLAPASAAGWYAAALRLLPPDADPGRRSALLGPLAASLGSAGRLEESRAALEELLGLLPPEAAALRGRVAAFVAVVDHLLGRHGDARALLERTLPELPAGGSEAASLMVDLASDRFFVGDWEAMREWAARAWELALDDPALRPLAAAVMALAEYSVGRVGEAGALMAEAAELVDGERARLDAFDFLGWCELSMERYEEAVDHFDRGLALGRATGQGHLLMTMSFGAMFGLVWLGRLAEAEERSDETMELARLSGSDQLMSWALVLRCWLELRRGRLSEALAVGEEALECGSGVGVNPFSAVGGGWLGEARVEAGSPARGRDELLAALGGPELPLVERAFRAYFYEVLVRAELALGRVDAAASWAALAEESTEGIDLAGRRALAMRARAAVELARGAAEPAAAIALEAAEDLGRSGHPVEAARCRILAGRALGAAGPAEAATEVLERALAELDRCGAERYRDEAVREMRRFGRAVGRGGRRATATTGLDALSDREREIAALVRDRLTNREIAERLVLSEKTIERHMSHIFRKLGARSRVEVARALERAPESVS
jgi:DNA-binding NarL/FixJ family response regulator